MERSVSGGESSKRKQFSSDSELSSSDDEDSKLAIKSKQSKKRGRKTSESSSNDSDHKRKKHKKKHKSKEKKEKKKDKKKKKKSKTIVGPEVPQELLEKSKHMAPMTEAEWEKKQSVIKRVYDAETGRTRLIKGSGEILEEIVSKDMHKQINKQATIGDGDFFQSALSKSLK